MNESHRIEIEELLNDLVDDQATERQETEFKRLAKHDPAIVRSARSDAAAKTASQCIADCIRPSFFG